MKGDPVPAKTILRSPAHFLAFGFGSGLAPRAPGTAGSLLALVIWLPIALLPLVGQVAVVLLASLLGAWICGASARKLGVHDHGGIVWDEFAGMWLTLLLLPPVWAGNWFWLPAGFVLFRFFDIAKPWPIRRLDRQVGGGLGIMLDDIIAALYAAAAGRLLEWTWMNIWPGAN